MQPNKNLTNTLMLITAVIVIVVLSIAIGKKLSDEREPKSTKVTSFIECEAAGYPVMESYPRQCKGPDGQNFVEIIETSEPPMETPETPVKMAFFTTLAEGNGIDSTFDQEELVLPLKTSQSEFEEVWNQLYPDEASRPELPVVDFANSQVVIVSRQGSSSGYAIDITDITIDEFGIATVKVDFIKPTPDCINLQVITHPFEVVQVNGYVSEFKYSYRLINGECNY